MPTYEYLCGECGHQFEELQKIVDDALVTCPSCGKDALRRLVSATAFHLKGSGWYKTDYASGSSNAASSTNGNGTVSSSSDTGKKGDSSSDATSKEANTPSSTDSSSQKSTSTETKAETKTASNPSGAKTSGTTDS